MERDLRGTPLYGEIEGYLRAWLKPGSGLVRNATDLAVSPDGRRLAFSGTLVEKLEGTPTTRICILDLEGNDLRVVSFGPSTDRLPKWSPDGMRLAFLSDREAPGQFQPYLLDLTSGATEALPRPQGWVEYLHWRPDGHALLLGVAGLGADLSGAQGGVATKRMMEPLPTWMPEVETGDETFRWRSSWVLDLETRAVRPASPAGLNPWEACWASADRLLTVASDAPDEAAWYRASLRLLDPATGSVTELYRPQDQLGWPSAAPDGQRFAVVEAVCSDRWVVAGELLIVGLGGVIARCDTRGVDVTFTSWVSDDQVLYAGHRSFKTVVGLLDVASGTARELWTSAEATVGTSFYPEVAPVPGRPEAFACVATSFTRAPALSLCEAGSLRELRSFASADSVALSDGIGYRPLRWRAPDGLEIHGWLLRPASAAPHPLVMEVHGGPVWQYRHAYVGATVARLALLRRGYAIFLPNPRGSSGRGQDYARRVFGDMGGADTHDYLSGLDHLVGQGLADPKRLGVMGGSYGGFMSSWLVTQDTRFAAAVPIAPVTNWVSEHLTCHIPLFCEQFLADDMTNPGGKYFSRSPVMFASRVRTPTLNICGALDRNTPPGQALEFHHAMQMHGVESVLVTYPEEGHGVRKMPASIDFAARVVGWFERHLPAAPDHGAHGS